MRLALLTVFPLPGSYINLLSGSSLGPVSVQIKDNGKSQERKNPFAPSTSNLLITRQAIQSKLRITMAGVHDTLRAHRMLCML
jgi:hypothetical protein